MLGQLYIACDCKGSTNERNVKAKPAFILCALLWFVTCYRVTVVTDSEKIIACCRSFLVCFAQFLDEVIARPAGNYPIFSSTKGAAFHRNLEKKGSRFRAPLPFRFVIATIFFIFLV